MGKATKRQAGKKQIRKLSPHQNAKVLSVLMAVAVVPFMVPTFAVSLLFMPPGGRPDFPAYYFAVIPLLDLVVGYLTVFFGCWLYNLSFRWLGGVEFEFRK